MGKKTGKPKNHKEGKTKNQLTTSKKQKRRQLEEWEQRNLIYNLKNQYGANPIRFK